MAKKPKRHLRWRGDPDPEQVRRLKLDKGSFHLICSSDTAKIENCPECGHTQGRHSRTCSIKQ
jgi:hypothetical protein